MPRLFHLSLIAIMIFGAVVTYSMKYRAEDAADRLAELRAQVAAEKDALDYLKAEWSVLTQPARLQELVALHADELGLVPIEADQVGNLSEIPPRPQPPEAQGTGVAAGAAASPNRTGAVAR